MNFVVLFYILYIFPRVNISSMDVESGYSESLMIVVVDR